MTARIPGHGLQLDGRAGYQADGQLAPAWPPSGMTLHAKCRCGALSPPGLGKKEIRRWHIDHKAAAAQAAEPAARAAYEAHGLPTPWEQLPEDHRDAYRRLALKGQKR